MKNFIIIVISLLTFTTIKAQITFDGNITETEWGTALATAAGGPTSGFSGTNQLNALYVTNQADDIYIGIAGDIEFGNRILLFIDSKTGGYSDGSFGRMNAPFGINNFNSGTIFDAGFAPDYCLVIGEDQPFTAYFFDLFELSATGANTLLGTSLDAGYGGNPIGNDNTRGFEATIPKSSIGFSGGNDIQVMAMYISDLGFLSNQFLTIAGAGQGDYGNGAVNFGTEPPNPITVSQTLLPVELANFEAELTTSSVFLNWTTTSEENNAGFEIQKSINGKDFEQIGFVAGNSNSLKTIAYQFIDKKPNFGENYYRLKQLDFDGQFEYSKIISVDFKSKNNINIYPNPVSETLIFDVITQDNYDIRIFDVNGRLVIEKLNLNGFQSVNLNELKAGNYFLIIQNSITKTIIEQQKIIKN